MAARQLGLVIVDRDGVINMDSPEYIKSPDEWRALSGSLEALAALTRAGAEIVVATNQSGVGRGLFSQASLSEIHAKMERLVVAAGGRIAGIYYCPHHPDDGCRCRKPAPGLLEQIAADFDRGLQGVPLIGDNFSDVLAAQAVGARPILVGDAPQKDSLEAEQVHFESYADLATAANVLIAELGRRS